MTDEQIKHMVDRFLMWKLPENFNPDGGISFKRDFNENTPWPMKHEPSGTNLFDATQAEAMVRHMVEGLPLALRAHIGAREAWQPIERGHQGHDGRGRVEVRKALPRNLRPQLGRGAMRRYAPSASLPVYGMRKVEE